MKTKPQSLNKVREISKALLLVTLLIPILVSCSDFIDEKAPDSPTVNQPPPQEPQQTPPTPKPPHAPETSPSPKQPPSAETEEQRNWRLCEAERMWAFNSRLIDSGALQIYQRRNFAPVFNQPGERQSGIEGWYACSHALELNGFIPSKVSDHAATQYLE